MVVGLDREDLCLHQLFEEQARRSPQAPAFVDTQGILTYEELDRRAELLAGYLRSPGVGPRSRRASSASSDSLDFTL